MIEKVNQFIERYKELEKLMSSPEVSSDPKQMEKLGREYNQLGKSIPIFQSYVDAKNGLKDAKEMLKDDSDPDMQELAQEEIDSYKTLIPELEEKIKLLIIPKDPNDLKNAMLEIRAGTGGTEAGLFAADLYRMYTHFADAQGWKLEILSFNEGEKNAIKEVIFSVIGEGAYGILKYESGVHRVQRIPETESQGRVHTSAATVAVFPEAEDVEVEINPADLRIDVYRSSGPGGQSVNTTDSAVRIVHEPTGITVTCQDEKSQHKNKAKAMKVLQSRLFDMKQREQQEKESANRRSMISTGDRSAKIRTYNFPQGRVTDHRINLSLYRLEEIMNGSLMELVDALTTADINEKMKAQNTN